MIGLTHANVNPSGDNTRNNGLKDWASILGERSRQLIGVPPSDWPIPTTDDLRRNPRDVIKGGPVPANDPVPPSRYLVVVDRDQAARDVCLEIARGLGFVAVAAASQAEAREIVAQQDIDVLLLCLKSSGKGLDLLKEMSILQPLATVIVTTPAATVSTAVTALRLGAVDYLAKPIMPEELASALERVLRQRHPDPASGYLQDRIRNQQSLEPLMGRAPAMERLYQLISKVATSASPVLISGEKGTGKEVVARAIHFNGPNAEKPFLAVDCGSMIPSLLERELFGYVKGAFAGADLDHAGLLYREEGGTVFLDGVEHLSLEVQARLMRALQDREFLRIGASSPIRLSIRLLAASSQDLLSMVERRRFRRDLYSKLNVVNLQIPSLRQRPADIEMLATSFLDRNRKRTGQPHTLPDHVLRLLCDYDWPGNLWELESVMEQLCVLSSDTVVRMSDLPVSLLKDQRHSMDNVTAVNEEIEEDRSVSTVVSLATLEKRAILGCLQRLNGDKLMAAKLLGIGKTTLYRKLKEYDVIETEDINIARRVEVSAS
jgi:DNA-binding NtrC family response regulator